MKYRYTVVFSIYGILPRDGQEHLLIEDSDSGLRAILTSDANPYLSHSDRSDAIASMMLRGMFGGAMPTGDFDDRLATMVEEIRQARKKQFGQSGFVVITAQGEVQVDEPRAERETDEFVVWIEGGNKKAIQDEHESRVTAALNSVILYDEKIGGIRLVADSVAYFREDGKPIYARTVQMGQATAYVSSPIGEDAEAFIQRLYTRAKKQDLSKVQRLLRRSFEIEEDRFQAFLSAWLALEILVQKVFPEYEARFFDDRKSQNGSRAEERFWARIRGVMKDKYGIADKFAAIAFQLDPSNANQDLEAVEKIKRLRDGISHGDSFNESQLALEQIRIIVRKYLLLHINPQG